MRHEQDDCALIWHTKAMLQPGGLFVCHLPWLFGLLQPPLTTHLVAANNLPNHHKVASYSYQAAASLLVCWLRQAAAAATAQWLPRAAVVPDAIVLHACSFAALCRQRQANLAVGATGQRARRRQMIAKYTVPKF